MSKTILKIENLNIRFEVNNQVVNAVKKISFNVYKGECMAIVGESGSGKSVTALSIMKLIKSNSQLKIKGKIIFESKNFQDYNSQLITNNFQVFCYHAQKKPFHPLAKEK